MDAPWLQTLHTIISLMHYRQPPTLATRYGSSQYLLHMQHKNASDLLLYSLDLLNCSRLEA